MLEKWTPLRELDLFERRMRNFFGDFGLAPAILPAADVYDTEGEFVLELEVPGFDEKDLEIEIFDHTLAVKGERRETVERPETELRIHERLEKHFERRFVLPIEADTDKVKATYDKGLLTLHVPRTPVEKPRKIAISKP
jgi:HSP20 family protein